MEIKKDYYFDSYDLRCAEHGSIADYAFTVNYGGVIIPMCQTCIDELYEAILPHVSAEVRESHAKSEDEK